jgi:hypothetical protein
MWEWKEEALCFASGSNHLHLAIKFITARDWRPGLYKARHRVRRKMIGSIPMGMRVKDFFRNVAVQFSIEQLPILICGYPIWHDESHLFNGKPQALVILVIV